MSEELRPCPFCGSNQIIEDTVTDNTGVIPMTVWVVKCTVCDSFISSISNPYRAINRWNTRPAEDALKKVIADIAATLAMGADLPEDDIFAMCKDAIGEKAILDRYNEKLRERVGDLKQKAGKDTNVPAKNERN